MGLIQDVAKIDRPILGSDIPILVFRVFRHFTAGYVEEVLGRGAAVVFQNGGRELGKEAGQMLYRPNTDDYLREVLQFVRDSRIGILIPRRFDDKQLVIDLDECITCAGMASISKRICHFEVGFVAGIVEVLIKKRPKAYETKCGANGEETCQVTVDLA
ncbi:MAG: 4-vinyl reductase [Polyangiaceae bacterium]|nr:4-vinyl reductase [Polyangiaceae bacterium]